MDHVFVPIKNGLCDLYVYSDMKPFILLSFPFVTCMLNNEDSWGVSIETISSLLPFVP